MYLLFLVIFLNFFSLPYFIGRIQYVTHITYKIRGFLTMKGGSASLTPMLFKGELYC